MLAVANGLANEIAKFSFSLQKFHANGCLRQNSLAIDSALNRVHRLSNQEKYSQGETPGSSVGHDWQTTLGGPSFEAKHCNSSGTDLARMGEPYKIVLCLAETL